MPSIRFHIILFSLFLLPKAYGEYVLEGTVNMSGSWQHQIFLATIDNLDDYYKADAAFTINQAPIDENGYFKLVGDNLPEEKQFYRLYLIKEADSEFDVCLHVGGDNHNFVHLIMDNHTQINIKADPNSFAPFGDYTITSDKENTLMKALNDLVYPAHSFYEIKFPSELKFSRDKLNRDLFKFADTCSSPLVALAAINNTDFENYIDVHQVEYEQVLEKMQSILPNHDYTRNYFRKYKFFADDWENEVSFPSILNLILGFVCLLLLLRILKLENQKPCLLYTSPSPRDS